MFGFTTTPPIMVARESRQNCKNECKSFPREFWWHFPKNYILSFYRFLLGEFFDWVWSTPRYVSTTGCSGNKIAYTFLLLIMRENRCSENRRYISIEYIKILKELASRKNKNIVSLSKCKNRPWFIYIMRRQKVPYTHWIVLGNNDTDERALLKDKIYSFIQSFKK